MIAKNNNGIFPVNRVYEVIDGRVTIRAHGPREMLIWGTKYCTQAADDVCRFGLRSGYIDVPFDPEAYVRSHIRSLIDYLYRIQQK